MTKTVKLNAALNAGNKKLTAVPPPAKPTELKASVPAQQVKPIRVGKKGIVGYFDPAVSRQLRQMALDQDCTQQELLREALNDLFEKHHAKPIA